MPKSETPILSRRVKPSAILGRRPATITMLAVLLSLSLVACGSTTPPVATGAPLAPSPTPLGAASPVPASGSPEPSASSVPSENAVALDTCKLLPPALLSNILGKETAFPKAVSSSGWDAGQCAWNGADSSFILRVGTASSIAAYGDSAAPNAKAMFEAYKAKANAAGRPKVIAGIGDGAVAATGGMAAYVGGTYFEVAKLRLTDDQLVEIMRLAVANLEPTRAGRRRSPTPTTTPSSRDFGLRDCDKRRAPLRPFPGST